jgi:hypothetical protein
MNFTIPLNFFLLGSELLKEFYTDSAHVMSAKFLFFGINGHAMIAPYIWGGLLLNLIALVIVLIPPAPRIAPGSLDWLRILRGRDLDGKGHGAHDPWLHPKSCG